MLTSPKRIRAGDEDNISDCELEPDEEDEVDDDVEADIEVSSDDSNPEIDENIIKKNKGKRIFINI